MSTNVLPPFYGSQCIKHYFYTHTTHVATCSTKSCYAPHNASNS